MKRGGVIVLLLAVLACGDSTGPRNSASGTWSGTVIDGSIQGSMTLTLTQLGDSVTGSGIYVDNRYIPLHVTATGTRRDSDVWLTLDTGFHGSMTYSATLTSMDMFGVLDQSGFIHGPMHLARVPASQTAGQ